MLKKFFAATIFLLMTSANCSAVDVWTSSFGATGERGNSFINEYVITETIQSSADKFIVDVKDVSVDWRKKDDPNAEKKISVRQLEFRHLDDWGWCSYVNTGSLEAYVPIATHPNESVTKIFDVCCQYNSAIKLSAVDTNALEARKFFDKGNAFKTEQNFNAAIDCYTQAINLFPNYSAAYTNRGEAYFKLGNFDAAIADYQKALSFYPVAEKIHVSLSFAKIVPQQGLEEALAAKNGRS